MNRVFISYRRDDATGYAGRLEDALERRLGRGSVFRDVQDIPPGADFVAAIHARLAGAQSVLVLIGPRWAGDGAPGQRRIDDEGDFVRLEVEVALDSGTRVVPVLLPGAASFLSHPRAIEMLEFDGRNLRFETRTQQTMGNETRAVTHHYSGELRGQPPDERLAMRMQTSGAFDSPGPLEFELRRVAAAAASAAAR